MVKDWLIIWCMGKLEMALATKLGYISPDSPEAFSGKFELRIRLNLINWLFIDFPNIACSVYPSGGIFGHLKSHMFEWHQNWAHWSFSALSWQSFSLMLSYYHACLYLKDLNCKDDLQSFTTSLIYANPPTSLGLSIDIPWIHIECITKTSNQGIHKVWIWLSFKVLYACFPW